MEFWKPVWKQKWSQRVFRKLQNSELVVGEKSFLHQLQYAVWGDDTHKQNIWHRLVCSLPNLLSTLAWSKYFFLLPPFLRLYCRRPTAQVTSKLTIEIHWSTVKHLLWNSTCQTALGLGCLPPIYDKVRVGWGGALVCYVCITHYGLFPTDALCPADHALTIL